MNLRLLSPTLVVVVVGALVASAYADGLWVTRVLAESTEGPVEGVTSDCGPGCRDDGGPVIICPVTCIGYTLYCLYRSCVRWVYSCDCVRLPDNMPVSAGTGGRNA